MNPELSIITSLASCRSLRELSATALYLELLHGPLSRRAVAVLARRRVNLMDLERLQRTELYPGQRSEEWLYPIRKAM